MDIRKKFKSFVTRLDPSSPVDDLPPPVTTDDPAIARFKEHLHVNDFQDPAIDREIIASIEPQYMNDDTFDSSEYELNKLPEKVRMQEIDDDRNRLRRQLQAVSKKVSELVLENHPSYAAELQRVMELQGSLNTASLICTNGRRQLAMAKQGFTTASLSLLANYRKRQQLMALLKSLRTIKTLQRTDIRLREMMEEEDYPGAIQLCLECQKAASTFRHYKCISELNSKLQDTLVMIEEQLDVALSKTCSNFDTSHYDKVQTAYRLLGKTQTAMDQLHMHFTSAIHMTAFTIVLGYVELTSGTGDNTFQKRQYNDLCSHISHETFIPCLIDLCKALWEVMKSYHKTIQWHEQQDKNDCVVDAGSSSSIEASFNRRYVQQKLELGLTRIWGDVQQKVKAYVSSTDLSHFKFDEFIQVLDLVNRLVKVGEEFCNSKSESLQESIRLQTSNYFKNYHRARLDELRMFLDNEGWELCPVKSNFSLMQLQEFRFMRNSDVKKSLSQSSLQLNTTSSSQVSYFERFVETGSPFDVQVEEEESEDVLEINGYHSFGNNGSGGSDSDDDVPDELKQDFIDEQTGEVPVRRSFNRQRSVKQWTGVKSAPIISNTTLTVLRIFGKYLQMMDILQTIAFDVIFCMSQLFDLYLYAVYSFFSNRQNEDQVLSSKLQTTLERIRNGMILGEACGVDDNMVRITQPHLCPAVDLSGVKSLHGLAERVVAVESLVFLSEQLTILHDHLESSVPLTKRAFLQQFFSQTVSIATEVRQPVYRGVTEQVIDDDQLLHQMSAVKWDIKDIMSEHSSYVDTLLRELQIFNTRLSDVSKRVPIPASATDVLWEHCVRLASKTFVDGYASARKCTNEGRALMQLDFQQFLMKLEKLTTLRPIPGRELVEGYIKAYYLPEAQLEVWIKEKKEYSPRQLLSLVNCVPHINRKSRQRLHNLIEDPDKSLKKDNLLDFSFPKLNKIS